MNRYSTLLSFALVIFFTGTNFAHAQALEGLISNFSFFLRNIVLPFLISIAFLYFLINMVRYFIIQGASEDGRAKAKRNATYGIIAFVFLFSLWTIVAWVVSGVLGSTNTDESMCPDYLGSFCSNTNTGNGPTGVTFPGITPGTGGTTYPNYPPPGTGTGTGGPGTGGPGTGGPGTGGPGTGGPGTGGTGTGGTGTGGTGTGGTTNVAGLAELVFGTGRDSATFVTNAGDPRGSFNTVIINSNSNCQDGLTAMRLGSRAETNQGAYVLYRNSSNAVQWQNITDLNSTNHISYDRDVLDSIVSAGAQDIHIVHFHPEDIVEQLDLTMDGRGPAAADMRVMCEMNNPALTYLTVDWNGVWIMNQESDTCPYGPSEDTTLPLLETYNYLASLDSSTRLTELTDYLNSPLVAQTYKDHFNALNLDSFSSYTPEEIIALGDGYQTFSDISIQYSQSIDAFCATY